MSIPWPWLAGALGLFFGLALLKENYDEYRRIELRRDEARQQLEAIRNARPRLVVARCERDQREIIQRSRVVAVPYVLSVYILNDPPAYLGAPAKDVYAIIDYDDGASKVVGVYGRWGDSDQPALAGPLAGLANLNATTINIGATRELNVAIRYTDDSDCYAFDTVSLASGQWRRDNYKLSGERVQVKIRLRGENVDESVAFIVTNPPTGAPSLEPA